MGKYPVIDADGHVVEKDAELKEYLPDPYRRFSSIRSLFPQDNWDRRLFGRYSSDAPDAKAWLETMDRAGVETAVLYPTGGLLLGAMKDRDWAAALAHGYNSYLHEQFSKASPRLKGVALLPAQNVPAAVSELRRAVTELGMVGGMLPADGFYLLGKPEFHPIYAEAQALDCMLAIHAAGNQTPGGVYELFDRFVQLHTVGHPHAIMRHLTSVIFEGVPEKYPRLRLAFLEAGCSWVPFWMNRMDEEYAKRGDVEATELKKKPSEYVKSGRIYFQAEPSEDLLPAVANVLGDGVLTYASDFPHWDHEFPESLEHLLAREDLTESTKRQILVDNPRRLYNLS
jgi:predicted TIM-barrel fold metal-dependent hydrolase